MTDEICAREACGSLCRVIRSVAQDSRAHRRGPLERSATPSAPSPPPHAQTGRRQKGQLSAGVIVLGRPHAATLASAVASTVGSPGAAAPMLIDAIGSAASTLRGVVTLAPAVQEAASILVEGGMTAMEDASTARGELRSAANPPEAGIGFSVTPEAAYPPQSRGVSPALQILRIVTHPQGLVSAEARRDEAGYGLCPLDQSDYE